MKWTKEQERAIYTEGTDVLVAAAAGSGKTAVLVERIIQKLLKKENPLNIDELLVVTFTNAAAQEMRHRIGAALESALKEHPSSAHLKKQLSLLQRASISTLHSFCMEVIRKYSYQLDIDPHFRIADDVEADLIRQEVLEELFEEWYGKEGEEQEQFFAIVDRFSSDRSDMEVEELLLKLYDFAMQNPSPEQWLSEMTEMYNVTPDTREDDLAWMPIMKKDVQRQLQAMIAEANQALDITRESDGPYHYADAIDADIDKFERAAQLLTEGWESLYTFFHENSKFTTLSRKKVECNTSKQERVKDIRKRYKKRWEDLQKQWFSRSLTYYLQDLQQLHPVMKQLSKLVVEFHERYRSKKKEQAIVDFADLEHYCLNILLDSSSTASENIPSSVATQYQQQFREILVDEYQDTNLVQETILQLITAGEDGGDLFMVGDVKQSIYRFRHAEPTLFITKYKRFAHDDNDNVRIDLSRNFRSRHQVLSATNYIFRQILDEEVGEIQYDEDAELIFSNQIYEDLVTNNTEAELLIIDNNDDDKIDQNEDGEDFRDLQKAQIEARAYAEKIKQWIGQKDDQPLQVIDKQTEQLRNVQFRDIVILMRSMTWAPTIVEELKQQGIPVYAELSTGYFEAIEVKVMISLLKVIDNPQQDIPLASVLRSPIVGLDEDALAKIRLAAPKESYYVALKSYQRRGESEKLRHAVDRFLMKLETWRTRARQGSLSELIWDIYRETGYYDFVGGIPGGRQRQANLRALYDRARSYESTSFRGLFRFLRFVERMEERGEDLGAARALGEQEDVVRIMTIHKSKGLEFPVVIVGGMDKEFNQQDLRGKYLLHKDLGAGVKFVDPEKRIMYSTLPFNALKVAKQREMLAEEMRVLYVALTRAKEKLFMVGVVNDIEKRKKKWQLIIDHKDWVLPAYFRLDTLSYLNWVAPAILRHESGSALRENDHDINVASAIWEDRSAWKVTIEHAVTFTDPDTITKERKEDLETSIKEWQSPDQKGPFYDEVDQRFTFQYPFAKAAHYRAKQTVTELKRQREMKDEYSSDQLVKQFRRPIVKRPRFMQEEKKLTAAEKGSAMHTVMQHIPLTKTYTRDEVVDYVDQLVHRELLTKDEATVIDIQAIVSFFKTDMGKMILSASEVQREVPFSLGLPANEVYPDWQEDYTDEKVLLQGVIDCLIPTEKGYILLDYKTDSLPEELTEENIVSLKKRYELQLTLYKRAVENILQKPVQQAYLYFFDKSYLLKVIG
ncbi:helicase-exonuclease AddAB subunit AddA [Salirhabdus salicampi]|uniref:helicase-exonuclease AddAB subunit AddA n=1 Tax=Salirhabdus salicampi TaxID=476102 RepID=UPI0020C47845|nr:helicase-exonuclease AddAB subunit AddA [Salirhabdus salicampi]MCP8615539.1 helicase-exonuclease AddAB subunit AddA [Salirhabdus salicampi]